MIWRGMPPMVESMWSINIENYFAGSSKWGAGLGDWNLLKSGCAINMLGGFLQQTAHATQDWQFKGMFNSLILVDFIHPQYLNVKCSKLTVLFLGRPNKTCSP